MGMPPTASRSLAVTPVGVAAASDSQCLSPSSPRGDSARRPRTKQLAWTQAHGSRVSRATVSSWLKKKALNFPLSTRPCSLSILRMSLPPHWNWMNCGRLCSKQPTRVGCGLPCAARHGKWSPMRLRDRSKQTCLRLWESIPFAYRRDIVSPTAGWRTGRCFLRNNIRRSAKRPQRPLMSSAGRIRCASV
jgi:hypothetical protein